MTDPRIDAQLKEFLGSWQHDQQQGHTIANLRIELHQVRLEVEELRNENKLLRLRVDRHGQRIFAIEQKLEIETSLDTGQHEIEDLRRALAMRERELEERTKLIEERKEEERWWRRTSVRWIVAGVAWIVSTLVTVATALLLGAGGHKR